MSKPTATHAAAHPAAPHPAAPHPTDGPPLVLRIFTLVLLCSGCAINGVFVSLAIPAMASYGVRGMLAFALVGGCLGVLPARWLANKIHEGLTA